VNYFLTYFLKTIENMDDKWKYHRLIALFVVLKEFILATFFKYVCSQNMEKFP